MSALPHPLSQKLPDPIRFERLRLPSGAMLHINSTPKLKTILVKAMVTGNLDASVTQKALLPMVLRRGTGRFPDMKAVHRHLEDLYGTSLVSDVAKVGEWHLLRTRLEVVNDRFLPSAAGVSREAVSFLRELIFEPRMVDGTFDPEYLDQEKHNLRRTIEGLIDDKAQYAIERCIACMCAGEEFRRFELGEVADLDAIDAPGLTATYREWAASYPLDLYLSGDIERRAAEDLLCEVFREGPSGEYKLKPPPEAVAVGEPRTVVETMEVNQGKLVLGFRHGVSYGEGDLEAMVVMNGILGSFSHSKLFQNVREKASLAYDIHSALEKTKGLLFVVGGIAGENYPNALEIILRQISALKQGEITDDELLATRESLSNHLTLMEDNPGELMEADHLRRLHQKEFDLPAYRRSLLDVERDRIAAAAQLLKLDTIYFLRS